jgi:hypothetical protein
MRRLMLLGFALAALGCGAPRPATAILVTVTADGAVRSELASLRIRVLDGEGAQAYSRTRAAAELSWPVELPIVPRDDDATRTYTLEVSALDASGGALVVHRVASSFASGQSRRLHVHLEAACLGVACDEQTSCRDGACERTAYVDPNDLPVLDGGIVVDDDAGAMDAGVDAGATPDAGVDAGDAGQGDVVTLTVRKHPAATGTGTLSFDVGGPDCGAGCTEQRIRVRRGTSVNLRARPDAGSFFQDWSGASCAGPSRFCSVVVDADQTLTATFSVNDRNLVFATSERFTGDFGGIASADAHCERLARDVGLSGTFIATLSEPGTNVIDRMRVPSTGAAARGFVRLDGRPIADTIEDLTANRRIWYPVHYDENGGAHDSYTWSGSTHEGLVADTCEGWTSRSDDTDAVTGVWGDSGGGPQWLEYFAWTCSARNSLVCVQIDHATPISAPARVTGKVMWLSSALLRPGAGGVLAADTLCSSERPAAVASARALLATTSAAASSLLADGVIYVRPDGIPLGTREDFIAGTLQSGAWVHADSTYDFLDWAHWTGSLAFDAPAATGDQNCHDWSSAEPTASVVGNPTSSSAGTAVVGEFGWWSRNEDLCVSPHPIVCVEQ